VVLEDAEELVSVDVVVDVDINIDGAILLEHGDARSWNFDVASLVDA
jgi:hypothetical protein